jgi:hypothetical protein
VKTQRFLIALTVINCTLVILSFAQLHPAWAADSAPVLRGSKLEIVDERGRVRASIAVIPADPTVKMPDGTTGYPQTVLLRLINAEGRPNIKIDANELGGGVMVGGASDPTNASLRAGQKSTSLRMVNQDGRERLIEP